jgi:hypothetical protein
MAGAIFFFFFFLVVLGLNSGPHTYKVDSLLEPLPQLFFALVIFWIQSPFGLGPVSRGNPPTYASIVAGITDKHHHTWQFFVILDEINVGVQL